MIGKKLHNLRKDVTETRNNSRVTIQEFDVIKDDLEAANNNLKIANNNLTKNNERISVVKKAVVKEFMRRDGWERAAAEAERLADGKPVWVIKCPETEAILRTKNPMRGDYAYCSVLKRYLESQGIYVVLQMYEDWYCDVGAEVEIVIASRREYHPDRRVKGRTNVMWLVSQPEKASLEMMDLYDLVLIDSKPMAEELNGKTRAVVKPFLVPAPEDIFYMDDSPYCYERVFVGNSRKDQRDCVRWCSNNGIELDVWGKGWDEYYKNDPYIHPHGYITFNETAEIYRKARVIVNDHQDEMISTGMINDRCTEALLCGKPLVCDRSQALMDEFGDYFIYYTGEEEFVEAMNEMDRRYDEICEKIKKDYDVLLEKYSFGKTIGQMTDMIMSVHNKR